MNSQETVTCAHCSSAFVPEFSFQTQERDGEREYYCSEKCRTPDVGAEKKSGETVTCAHCSGAFVPEFSFQIQVRDGEREYYCSEKCRTPGVGGEKKSQETVTCAHCSSAFVPKFSFQTQERKGKREYYCSQKCRNPGLGGERVSCSSCEEDFVPSLALHLLQTGGETRYACSESCREKLQPVKVVAELKPFRALAVLNQKGGTGKTTTALSVAAAFAQMGKSVLLVDLDPQGNVGVSLGITSPRSVYHMLHRGLSIEACAVPVRENLDVITADESLAAAEIELARTDEGDRTTRLMEAMGENYEYDYIIFDCAPALSVLNYSALAFAREVLIPVSCDYLALVGVKQVLRTLRRISEQTGSPVRVAGVLPTFYDKRNKVCVESLNHLRKTFGPRALPPVRVNTKLAEAPSRKQTIFEHAPDSNGALDYMRVVEWLHTSETKPATRAA